MHFNKKGEPISLLECGRLREDRTYSTVMTTNLDNGLLVSTVWLGLNHAHLGGPPLIFETMVFGGDRDGDCERYATEAEARAGHARVVAELEDK